MRKNINISLLISYFFLIPVIFSHIQSSHASTDNRGLNATVEINAVFNVTVTPASISFGNVDPGKSTNIKDIQIQCVSNNNERWSVQMNYTSPLTADTHTIPDESFRFWVDTDGSGQVQGSPGHMNITPMVFYTAASKEYITSKPVNINVHFQVDVPPYQARGNYATVIMFTMYED